ncbi:MAG: DNA starvation/stationary phase protection protein [Alphaproteobacteria bacterium]|nr:DNA starvation/stationary phase protection protein [Alphaproteobacteria bacterium]
MSNKNIVEALKVVLADSQALYLKTQNYHWNVEGPHFKSLHQLFEEQYTDLADAIDTIAELIRTLGEKAPGNWKAYDVLRTIRDGDEDATAEVMVTDLASDQSAIHETLQQALKVAQSIENEVVIGILVDRMSVHSKNRWMLNSSQ